MIKYKEKRKTTEVAAKGGASSNINARIVALITASAAIGSSLGAAVFNYLATERSRTQIAQDSLKLQQAAQIVGEAAQKTSEQAQQISAARLEFEKQVQLLTTAREDLRTQIARVGGMNDTRRTDNDELRTRFSFAKQQSDLIPSLKYSCNVQFVATLRAVINCAFENIGSHRIYINTEPIIVVDQISDEKVDGLVGAITGAGNNTLPVGGRGTNSFPVELKATKESFNGKSFKMTFQVRTDPIALQQVKEAGGKYVNEKHLTSLANQTFTFRYDIN